ncbi:cation/calcium exchanger 1-like [Phoenix dactylifera]|uniref:Cation/calcium exchanger 1-like n=1 Tax=Phoenix dactylifera TaxID=42345 RepID=A0A8B8IZ94_PHODC|nr:cation/calcium exchanger 1-like [Phoenix dactylifera]
MAKSISAATQKAKVFLLFLNSSFLLLILFLLTTCLHPPNSFLHQLAKAIIRDDSTESPDVSTGDCNGLHRCENYEAKCIYLASQAGCDPEGYINYLYLFYCFYGEYPVLGYTLLILWLVLLFYLLGNTAANYFCSNLENLSRLLKLPPTIAGVTLLSLGNGAPDAFSGMVSFMGTGSNVIGLNSILGGAFFVSCVVVGIISFCIGPCEVSIDKWSFIRDVCFLLFVLLLLLAIIIIGKINVWFAMAFTSLYLVYVLLVSIRHLVWKEDEEKATFDGDKMNFLSFQTMEHGVLGAPLLEPISTAKEGLWSNEHETAESCSKFNPFASCCCGKILYLLELPLYLPRRLTIPDVSKERWSKPIAVTSVTVAPIILTALWDSNWKEKSSEERLVMYLFGGIVGMSLGIAAFVKTKKDRPPTRFLFPWLAGGFLMSVIWTYIIAQELVSLLVSLGHVLDVSPSVLGLTVLAWGNSLGDLIANVAVALNGGPGGAQVAMSGCYGGPIFNTLVGLGLSLVFSSWTELPSPMVIPGDPSLLQTLGFLIGGLLWALVMLPKRGMKPDRVLGSGLLSIYLCFLILRFAESLGLLQPGGKTGPIGAINS